MVDLLDKGKDGGIIARLALPSKIPGKSRSSSKAGHALSDEEKEKKKEQMHRVVFHLFYNELRYPPEEVRVLFTEHVFTDSRTRAETAKWLFDDLETKALMFAPQEFLALIGSCRETGIVVNMGTTYISIVPIWNLNIMRDKAVVLPVGGEHVTRTLELLLKERRTDQVYHPRDFNPLVIEDIKEKRGYVALDYDAELSKRGKLSTEYELPDCQVLKLGAELFQCTECFFQPHLFGINDSPGLIESVNELIDTLDSEVTGEIVEQSDSVILTGSSSMFPGLVDRLQAGIREKHPSVKVIAPPERKLSAWIGGSIWAELSANKNSWTTREEFEAHGPSVVHSKCI